MHYILDEEGFPVEEPDPIRWSKWMSKVDCCVNRTFIPQDNEKPIVISTVFLGIDHNFYGGHPILYETMVFGGALDHDQYRWDSKDNAEAGHDTVVKKVVKTMISEVEISGDKNV